jgi:hypothetical protein
MPTFQLSDDEARILAKLLKQAGDEFSNHGCNDFNVERELALPEARAMELAHSLRLSMVEHRVADPDYAEDGGVYLMDWMLYCLFEKRVRALLPRG